MDHPRNQRLSPALVQADNVVRAFGDHVAVGPLSFSLPPGRSVALVGANGSGKSTLLRCLAGTLRLTSGEIRLGGHLAGTLPAKQLAGISLSQERSFDPRLSGHANLVFFARVRGMAARSASNHVAHVEEELELAEIVAERVSSYSTGMTQQLSFARTLIGDPLVLLLDEPTRSLDEAALERFWAAIQRRPNVAVVMATHREDDIARCHERIDLDR
jgi:ABC-type multidrug transport system ATPase subunit